MLRELKFSSPRAIRELFFLNRYNDSTKENFSKERNGIRAQTSKRGRCTDNGNRRSAAAFNEWWIAPLHTSRDALLPVCTIARTCTRFSKRQHDAVVYRENCSPLEDPPFFFFFAARESCSPSPTRYIFETHVILWKTLLPDVLSDAISSKIRFRNPSLSYIDKEEEEILVFSNRNSSTFLRIENYNIRYLWEREREYNRKLLTRFVEDAIYAERETLFETRRENYALNAHFTHRVEIFDSTRFINHRTERNESVKIYG